MARIRLQHVHRHERRSALRRRTLRLHQQPQLRRPSGPWWPHAFGESSNGRCSSSGWTFCGYPRGEIMEPFTTLTGLVAPLDRTNVNTDEITPARFLKTIRRTGFGDVLFANWRYLDINGQRPNPDFVLNQPRYQGASILLTGENFCSGSSREHAPWSIREYGFRCIIAPSFADIFYN